MRSKGVQVDPLLEEKIAEWKKYREQKEYEARLEALKLEQVISRELREILEEQEQRESEAILKEMAKFGGEPSGSWLLYYDASGLHRREEVQK